MAEEMFGEEEDLIDVIEKRKKIDESKMQKKPVDLPYYLKAQEESLNFTT